MSQHPSEKAIAHFEAHQSKYLEDLETLVKIPSISFPGFDPQKVRESAEAVKGLLVEYGFSNVSLLEVEGAHPAVFGELLVDEALPTVLLYAHHDVQPPGDVSKWKTEPFVPTKVGDRLFARGAADDKAGISVHLSAVDAWLKSGESLPVNLKIFIEGEEETGSDHLAQFLRQYKDRLGADAMVLTDTANFDTGIPSITVGLRGLVIVDVTVSALKNAVHSGMWGGPVPDAAMALSRLLSTLVDEQGQVSIPGLTDDMAALSDEATQSLATLPEPAASYRDQVGLLDGVEMLSDTPYESNWWRPAISINAIEASSKKDARSVLLDSAWARVGLRLAPGMDPDRAQKILIDHLKSSVPWGCRVEIEPDATAGAWVTETDHPAFGAASRALERGYGKQPVFMGCGGSIPFVEPMCSELGGIPALLIGVEDPYTNAHGENESLSLSDWDKAVRSAIYIYEELAGVLGK